MTVYKDSNAIRLVGEQGKFGAVFIETKVFARKRYWHYFSAKSEQYAQAVPNVDTANSIIYILNGKVLTTKFEADLSAVNDDTFASISIINKKTLKKKYNISDKTVGIEITTNAGNKK